jgi:hypothetical protein
LQPLYDQNPETGLCCMWISNYFQKNF